MKLFSALFALTALITVQAFPAEKPNLLVIMVDDLGYGDLSVYGAPDLKSPHIDALMNDGMRFDAFYANCPVCSPTRASFLTGLYPDMAGVPGVIRTPLPERPTSWGNLRNDVTTLPGHLKTAGYDTALIGKWHLGLEAPDRPNDVGFDFFHGFLGDMMDDYYDHLRHGEHYMRRNEEAIHPEGHATDLFTDWTVDYLNLPGNLRVGQRRCGGLLDGDELARVAIVLHVGKGLDQFFMAADPAQPPAGHGIGL